MIKPYDQKPYRTKKNLVKTTENQHEPKILRISQGPRSVLLGFPVAAGTVAVPRHVLDACSHTVAISAMISAGEVQWGHLEGGDEF
jgi:hypothetical protein